MHGDEDSNFEEVAVQRVDDVLKRVLFPSQVYMFSHRGGEMFSLEKLSSSIPVNLDPSKFSVDGVKVIVANNLTHLLVRSQSNTSRIYYSYQNQTTAVWSQFEAIADDKSHLQYDFDIAFNGFVKVRRCLKR